MKKQIQIIGVLAFLFITVRCGSSPKREGSANDGTPPKAGLRAEKLGRDTALALIKQDGQGNNEDPAVVFNIPSAIYTDDPNFSDEWHLPAERMATMQHAQQANLGFYKTLVAKGLLRQETSCDIHKEIPHRKYYCFAPNHPDVKSSENPAERGTTSDYNTVIAMARPSRILVTGVTQEGSDAEAEVQIDIAPTEAYKLLAPIIASTEAAYGERFGQVVWQQFQFIKPEDVTKSNKLRMSFRKYDDGWRLGH